MPESTRGGPGSRSLPMRSGTIPARPARSGGGSPGRSILAFPESVASIGGLSLMADLVIDPYVDLYADRMSGMSASEVRALFAVASRPEVVSLAGGMPDVRALSTDDVIEVVETVLAEHADAALQYGAGQGTPALRACLAALMNEEATEADADDFVVTTGAQQALDLIALCREARIPIVEDNPYGLLRFEGDREPTLRSLDPHNVIYVGTVSKVFSPGVRVGWAVAEPGLLQRLVLAKEAADLCGSSFTMLVTERYLSGERWRGNLERLVNMYRSRRDAMLAALDEHFPADASWTHPGGGFFVWVTLPDYLDTQAMLAAAVERRVAYVPGTAFYPDGRGRNKMRLAFCYPTEDDITEGVRRLGLLLADEQELYRSLSG